MGCGHAVPAPAQALVPQVFVQTTSDAPPGPQRLDHVVTLGHDAYLPGPRPNVPSAGQPGVTVQQNVIVNPAPAYGYGYGYSAPIYRTVPVNPVTGTPPVAGDWPKPPSYGPRPMR